MQPQHQYYHRHRLVNHLDLNPELVVEVAVEEFLENPAVIFAVDFEEIVLTEIGNDMTLDQKEKAQEVVVPVIIASQIISASVVPFRRIR